jgi:hypothetical protein
MLDSDTGKKRIKKWYNNEKLVKVVALAKQPSVKRGEGRGWCISTYIRKVGGKCFMSGYNQ